MLNNISLILRSKIIVAFLLGAFTVLGYAPFYFYPAVIAALAGLFYCWQKSTSPKQAAWTGFSYGLGFFGAGVSWIYVSLHDFGDMPFWMAGFSTLAFCAFLSLFPALVGYSSWNLNKKPMPALFGVAALWALSEWVRGWIFTGFPWLAVGYSQVPYSPFAGFAPIFGVYGVSFVTALTAGTLALWGYKEMRFAIGLGIAALWVSGSLLKLVEWTEPAGEPISVALVQGNIAQDLKWQPEVIQKTLLQYIDLTRKSSEKLIVLPETALPMLIEEAPAGYLNDIKAHGIRNQGDVLIGAVEFENGQYFNSMLSYGTSPTQTYRKSHLVPFGEFIPLKGVFGWIYRDWLNIPLTDLSRGDVRQKPLHIAGQKVALNICYEDVFGEEIIRQLPEATLLVNTSNDAWYGYSFAAHQHLQMSQTRALETGRMMLRATNTGATAIIDTQGNVVAEAPHFVTTILKGKAQGHEGATPYVRFGNWLAIPFCLLTVAFSLLWVRKNK